MQVKVVPWVKKATGNEGIALKQDGATSHTARMVRDRYKNNLKSFWPKDLWPPFSLDLNPTDCGMWSILEQKACAVFHLSIKALKTKVTKSWAKVGIETVHATCNKVIAHLCQVIKEKGGYTE